MVNSPLHFAQLSQDQAEAIAAWRYPEPFSFYDWTADPDDLRELLEPSLRGDAYWAAKAGGGRGYLTVCGLSLFRPRSRPALRGGRFSRNASTS